MLKAELESLATGNFDLDLTGFNTQELDELLAEADRSLVFADANDVPPTEEEVVSNAGDLWLLGTHRVLCGDRTSDRVLAEVLDGRKSDMVFTDLPYNVDDTGKTKRKLKIVNDNLGRDFSRFLEAACLAMLNATKGALYICML